MSLAGEMLKTTSLRAGVVVKINVAFLIIFLLIYVALFFPMNPSGGKTTAAASSLLRCATLRSCVHLWKGQGDQEEPNKVTTKMMTNAPRLLRGLRGGTRVALVNVSPEEMAELGVQGKMTKVEFELVSDMFKWEDLYPEWIDEEEESEGATCPEMPMPEFDRYGETDVVVAKVPCRRPVEGWNRDVARLQVQLVAVEVAVRKGRRRDNAGGRGTVRVVVWSKCEPLMEVFRCDDMVSSDGTGGEWWAFDVDVERLKEKLRLPVGSCELAMRLWPQGINSEFDASKLVAAQPSPAVAASGHRPRREAYATVLHSSDTYLCGAIMLAQSIRRTGTQRDLVLLHDSLIPEAALRALADAGWSLRLISRIRNPRAERGTYNEYNYSKFRLWQLTDYDRVVFIDADIVVLRSLDALFDFPEISAVGNDVSMFNSGVMVIEPSNCTFEALMRRRHEIVSYNGGDQGFLNEVFVWWHRLPRRVNYLKNFWANTTSERSVKAGLFAAEPPGVFALHYLGLKPWMCYRDYDCNWNIEDQRVYASDTAHRRWWHLYDEMKKGLGEWCNLSDKRRKELWWDRLMAEKAGYPDGHYKINVTDPRRFQ